jgi:RNA polymerase sigma factor (sigma-70 family)
MSQLPPHADTQLLVAIQQGDTAVWRKIYKQCYPVIQHFILTNSGDAEEAADIFQDALVLFHEQVQRPDFVLQCSIKTYLYSIVRRIWLKKLYKKGKFLGTIQDWEEVVIWDDLEEQDPLEKEHQYDALQSGLDKLGEPCKTVLQLFYIEKMNMQEIAEKMGYTNADSAKNQKYKCLNRLKKIVENFVND